MRYRSNLDDLTGLPLREDIRHYIEERLKEKKPFHIYMVDIDYFKVINDQFGHLRGDEIIKDVADLLRNSINENEFVGRYGGDEFIIVVSGSREPDELPLRLNEHLKYREFPGDPPVRLTLSFGHASYPQDGRSYVKLIGSADERLLERKRRRHTGIRFIGRENIISLLKGSLDQTAEGKPAFIHIIGKPGVGKSRILEELSVIAGMIGFEIIHSQCRIPGPNHPVSQFSIPGMVNLGWKITWKLREMSKKKPLLWVIDDIEYCPREMAGVLKEVFRLIEKERVMVVITGDPDYAYQGFTRIQVPPFDLKMTGEFIRGILGITNVDQRFILHAYRESEGIPGRIMMIVNNFLSSGILAIDTSGITLKEGVSIDLSESVINQFKSLSRNERRILIYAALLNDVATMENMEELLGLNFKKLEDVKRKGIRAGILVDDKDFRFSDNAVREAVINMENPGKTILQKAGDFLFERGYYSNAAVVYEMANKREKAFLSYIKTTRDFMERGLLADALNVLEEVSKWEEEKWFDRAEFHGIYADYYFRIGDYNRSIEHLDIAYQESQLPRFLLKKAKCYGRLGKLSEAYNLARDAGDIALPFMTEILIRLGDIKRAEMSGNLAIQVLEDPEYLVEAYAAIGGLMIQKGKLERALHHLQTGLTIARKMKDTYWLGILHNRMGVCYYLRSRLEDAKDNYYKALNYFSELGDTGTLIYLYLNLGIIAIKESNIEDGIEYYNKAYTISKDISQKQLLGRAARFLGELYLEIGELDKAKKYMNEALKILKETKMLTDLCHLYANMSRLNVILSRYDRAKENIQRAKGIAEKLKSPILKSEVLMREGEYHLRTGNLTTGKKLLDRLKNSCPDDLKGEYYLLLARVYDLLDKKALSRKYGEKAVQHHKLHGTLWAIGKDYLVLSRLKAFSDRAGEYSELSKEIFRRCGIEKGFEDYI